MWVDYKHMDVEIGDVYQFFRPFSLLLLNQRLNEMIKFTHSAPRFKYKFSHYHHLCLQ